MAGKEKTSGAVAETIKTVFWALILAGLIRSILFQPFWIPSGSMKPTLLIGDFLFVNKYAYGYSWASCPTIRGFNFCGFARNWEGRIWEGMPKQGDVIVFKHPSSEQDFIKRLIGLPGDRVQVIKGRLHVNNHPVDLVDAGIFEEVFEKQGPMGHMPRCSNSPVGVGAEVGAICTKEASVETLPDGLQHIVLNIGKHPGDDTSVFVVPDGHYFFMGDNRDNSTDSRFGRPNGIGFVPASHLIGRADRIMFSSAGRSILAFWTWRGDRYFKGLE